ncbi:uncharacterized protein C8Q71DRAFT_732878 [Rhodofomes roseus]|uniref:Uncharacterized protein n=1 Tax=Rhodofomes roseus TaxID=34475 RepID=A0ABQ8KTN9_9APHY|nr:uncharacterized protein C8Q71DRAFT_732878 [Rhodofomes roseus]KAH9842447.1 hypothetical protein C8Q71DRAFT_732878 [Rhodofomes roseus]
MYGCDRMSHENNVVSRKDFDNLCSGALQAPYVKAADQHGEHRIQHFPSASSSSRYIPILSTSRSLRGLVPRHAVVSYPLDGHDKGTYAEFPELTACFKSVRNRVLRGNRTLSPDSNTYAYGARRRIYLTIGTVRRPACRAYQVIVRNVGYLSQATLHDSGSESSTLRDVGCCGEPHSVYSCHRLSVSANPCQGVERARCRSNMEKASFSTDILKAHASP